MNKANQRKRRLRLLAAKARSQEIAAKAYEHCSFGIFCVLHQGGPVLCKRCGRGYFVRLTKPAMLTVQSLGIERPLMTIDEVLQAVLVYGDAAVVTPTPRVQRMFQDIVAGCLTLQLASLGTCTNWTCQRADREEWETRTVVQRLHALGLLSHQTLFDQGLRKS